MEEFLFGFRLAVIIGVIMAMLAIILLSTVENDKKALDSKKAERKEETM